MHSAKETYNFKEHPPTDRSHPIPLSIYVLLYMNIYKPLSIYTLSIYIYIYSHTCSNWRDNTPQLFCIYIYTSSLYIKPLSIDTYIFPIYMYSFYVYLHILSLYQTSLYIYVYIFPIYMYSFYIYTYSLSHLFHLAR